MLFPPATLAGLADGTISCAFRRWERPRVRPGGTQKTSVGVVGFSAVERVDESLLELADARAAGFESVAELLRWTNAKTDGDLYRIALSIVGPDPRVELRERADLDEEELASITAALDRLDRAVDEPWTRQTLRTIADQPAVSAKFLAEPTGLPLVVFKRRVRRLKELGLTISLEKGYRLSPRGATFLKGC